MKRILLMVFAITIGLVMARNGYAGQAGYDEKSVANFYRGKTVTIVVGHSAGGGFDRYARAIARHLGKYIPGNPAILVNNMVGAGTMVSANYTYNQAPRDGTVINSFDGGIWPSQLYGSSAAQFDLDQVQLHRRAGYFQIHHGGDQEVGHYQDGRLHVGRQRGGGRRRAQYQHSALGDLSQRSAGRQIEIGHGLQRHRGDPPGDAVGGSRTA